MWSESVGCDKKTPSSLRTREENNVETGQLVMFGIFLEVSCDLTLASV